MSIYDYERRIHLLLDGPSGIKQSKKLCPENKKTLLEYATFLQGSGKSIARQIKLLMTVKRARDIVIAAGNYGESW